ncbi:hypothetical protein NPS53_08060 [Pseudomonas putida]|uniref:hypothetical protein n=1 Tax=Pseudomonas putida TaxID=303 RepID=UPI0023640ABC|nr:hypothetical protein [Pseudomonas putida]MDD2139524.1 hypothetical protein [Pseudomonas putida]HDS1721852.1 hypothetical protein [Pseudomonas putida]
MQSADHKTAPLGTPSYPPRKQRIIEIAEQVVAGMIDSGSLNPDDETAMDLACRQAVADATQLYDAATEFLS